MLIKQSNNQAPTFELRASRMYNSCVCWKRNGLQDSCPRTACQGKSNCMNGSSPNCDSSSYPLKYTSMSMGGGIQGYEAPTNDYIKPADAYQTPMDGNFSQYPASMPMQMPSGGNSYGGGAMNGLSELRNWNGNQNQNQQGGYPCYI